MGCAPRSCRPCLLPCLRRLMSSSRSPDDALRKVLDEAESELHRRLHEACEAEAHGVSTESTAEIRRLEDALLSAAMAAERALTIRRHMHDATPADRVSGAA